MPASLINKESIDAIRTAVLELEKAGYITRTQGRDEKGKDLLKALSSGRFLCACGQICVYQSKARRFKLHELLEMQARLLRKSSAWYHRQTKRIYNFERVHQLRTLYRRLR